MNKLRLNSNLPIGLVIIGATFAFELFNYATTQFSLLDLVGNVSFAGVKWATMLAIAFCGIDLAGMAHLFTNNNKSNYDVWYLFGAWLLAAIMNAILTWWGVSIAMVQNTTLAYVFVEKDTLLKYTPILIAISVWLIRVLLIGTIALHGSSLFSKRGVASRYTSFTPKTDTVSQSAAQPTAAKTAPFVGQSTLRMH